MVRAKENKSNFERMKVMIYSEKRPLRDDSTAVLKYLEVPQIENGANIGSRSNFASAMASLGRGGSVG